MFVFDRTQRSVVVVCTQCHTREICTSQAAADRWAMDHIGRAHPGITPAEERRITAARHAEVMRRSRRNTPS